MSEVTEVVKTPVVNSWLTVSWECPDCYHVHYTVIDVWMMCKQEDECVKCEKVVYVKAPWR